MPIQLNLTYADNSVVSALYRPVCDLLGCTWPVVLAGMGGVARADLVSAVTLAGGFGFLGMVREPTELIRDEVRRFTVAPCGVSTGSCARATASSGRTSRRSMSGPWKKFIIRKSR
jgi:hypothetical protein